MEKIKILFVLDYINDNSGVSSMVLNYYCHMDKKNFLIDFLLYEPPRENILRYFEKYNSTVYATGHPVKMGYIKYQKEIKKFFSERQEQYQIVHLHIPNAAFVILKYAKKYGVQTRILHSHNSRGADSRLKRVRNKILNNQGIQFANHYMACSESAARYLFGNDRLEKVDIISNAINLEKFKFDSLCRERVSKKLGIKNELVLGHVGRFCRQKNHIFLIEIAKELKLDGIPFKLLLLGDGELKIEIQEVAKNAGIEDSILFLGVQKNVKEYMDVMDVFLLPSLYEGLPYVCVEAQVNGLDCLISDKVSREVELSDQLLFLGISDPKEWKKSILECVNKKGLRRTKAQQYSRMRNYDISIQSKRMEEKYIRFVELD